MTSKKNHRIPEFRLSGDFLNGIALKNLDVDQTNRSGHNIQAAHRDDHYMLVVLRAGRLKASIDFEEYEFDAPGLLMIFPEQVHQISPQTQLSGWAINFDAVLINDELKHILEKDWRSNAPFFSDIPAAWFKEIDNLLATIGQLYAKPLISSQSAIAALLSGLLFIITGNLLPQVANAQQKKSRPAMIKQQFLFLLYERYRNWKKPSEYAEKLNITTAHLNDTIKKGTGRSATEAIQEHCILEARRLLHYTDLDIKEVGCQIGYSNSSHFIKVFKSFTGLTPMQYRQALKNKS